MKTVDVAAFIQNGGFGKWSRDSDEEYRVTCPNPQHDDRNPSCSVNVRKNVFICRSCGAKGHVNKALKWVGQEGKASIGEYIAPTLQEQILLPEYVLCAWDEQIPWAWIEAGINYETLLEHEIGFDVVNQRITVPIRDKHGSLIGVSGRTVIEHPIRYKLYKKEFGEVCPKGYSPKKGRVLWRHHFLCKETVQNGVIVVEGFKGAMWLVQNGFPNVVAVMGKNVTRDQQALLVGLGVPVYIMFDQDPPGRQGAKDLGINLYRQGVDVNYVPYQNTLSPDDLTVAQIELALNEAEPHIRSKYASKMDTTRSKCRTPKRGAGRRKRKKATF